MDETPAVDTENDPPPGELVTELRKRRILVPTDFSAGADLALTLAIDWAKLLPASIDVLHVYSVPVYPVAPGADVLAFSPANSEVFAAIERSLATLSDRVRSAGVQCEASHVTGIPDEQIVMRAFETGADLIVMGTHGRSGIKHAILGSVAERVIQKASCPVTVVPPPERMFTASHGKRRSQ